MTSADHLLDVYSVWLHLTDTEKEWRKLRRDIKVLPKSPAATGATWVALNTDDAMLHVAFFVDLTRLPDQATRVDAIAHEAAHGTNLILQHIGQPHEGLCEAHAYLVGWLAGWMWRELKL